MLAFIDELVLGRIIYIYIYIIIIIIIIIILYASSKGGQILLFYMTIERSEKLGFFHI